MPAICLAVPAGSDYLLAGSRHMVFD